MSTEDSARQTRDTSESLSASTVIVTMVETTSELVVQEGDLAIHVYHLGPVPFFYQNMDSAAFNPIAFTLICSRHEAIIVDCPSLPAEGTQVAEWIQKTIPHKKLIGIYITHGHGDHFFSASQIQEKFPDAKILATQGVYKHMMRQLEPEWFAGIWQRGFPSLTKPEFHNIEIIKDVFYLEGKHELRAVEVGQGDCSDSTVLYFPTLKVVVGGDVVYGTCHQYFAEARTPQLRSQWSRSLDKVAALAPEMVIPAHSLPTDGYGVEHITNTNEYIEVFERLLATAETWQTLENNLRARFPNHYGDFILRLSSQSQFGASYEEFRSADGSKDLGSKPDVSLL